MLWAALFRLLLMEPAGGAFGRFFSIKLLKTISKRPVRIRVALLFLWKSIISLDILLLGKIYFTDFRNIKYQIPHFYFGHIEISWF